LCKELFTSFATWELQLDLDRGHLCSSPWMEGVVLDVIALLPHDPRHFQSFLDEGDDPTSSRVLFWKRVDVPLLGVGPFLSEASQQQLTPANAILFAHGMLGAPLVVFGKAGQGMIAAFPPLLESRDNCLGSRVDLCQAGFEFLEREHEGDVGACAFAFKSSCCKMDVNMHVVDTAHETLGLSHFNNPILTFQKEPLWH
jgi:hypothetical protein